METGLPYIKSMIEDGSDVLVLSEHWLWPYETYKLNEIHSEFQCDCKSDARLNETTNLSRGCGGIGIL